MMRSPSGIKEETTYARFPGWTVQSYSPGKEVRPIDGHPYTQGYQAGIHVLTDGRIVYNTSLLFDSSVHFLENYLTYENYAPKFARFLFEHGA